MKYFTKHHFVLTSFFVAGFLLLSGGSYAQQKSETEPAGTKTISIHIVKEIDGVTTTMDTVIVTDGDFDADVFVDQNDIAYKKPDANRKIQKEIIIRNPGQKHFSWTDEDGTVTDSIMLDDDRMMMFHSDSDSEMPSFHNFEGKPKTFYKFNSPSGHSGINSAQVEMIIEGIAGSIGLGNVMPFGDMKKMVVKKKRKGKKVIITFEDRDENYEHHRGNRNEEKVIIIKKGDDGVEHAIEKEMIIKGDGGEKIIIHNDDSDVAPEKQQKKVIIIKEEKTK